MDKKGSYDFGSFSELKVKHKFVFFIIKYLSGRLLCCYLNILRTVAFQNVSKSNVKCQK